VLPGKLRNGVLVLERFKNNFGFEDAGEFSTLAFAKGNLWIC